MSADFNTTSPLFIRIFRHYTWLLFYRRFKYVWLKSNYIPAPGRSTLYYANHSSWWDGLIPLLLNEFYFRQEGRAIMEDKQMERYRFFKKIGAVPINRSNPRSALTVLQKSAEFLNHPGRSLYFFPQGRIYTECHPLEFEKGLSKLTQMLSEGVDIVPFAISITTIRYDKPELFLKTDEPVELSSTLPQQERNTILEKRLGQVLKTTQDEATSENDGFERLV